MTTKKADELRKLLRDVTSFERKLEILQGEGLSRGKAIMFARKGDAEGFNLFMRRAQNRGLLTAQTL